MTDESRARFSVGEVVHHRLFNYRGVIVDVDMTYSGTEEWYQQMAMSRPPKNAPWYRVLVDDATHETYVAERNLQPDDSGMPVRHPAVEYFFDEFRDGHYLTIKRAN